VKKIPNEKKTWVKARGSLRPLEKGGMKPNLIQIGGDQKTGGPPDRSGKNFKIRLTSRKKTTERTKGKTVVFFEGGGD